MLNTGDVQLFCNLLDSLGNSLRELAIKYELLVSAQTHATADRQKTDAAVLAMSSEVLSMSKDIEALKNLVGDGREGHAKTAAIIQSVVHLVDLIHAKIDEAKAESSSAKSAALEGKSVSLHVDSHMDQFCGQIVILQTILDEIKKMVLAVEDVKKQVEPFKKLAVLFSKPAAIIVGIYVVIATVLSVIEGCDQWHKLTGKSAIVSSLTNSVSVKAP